MIDEQIHSIKVSICMITYNHEEYLSNALDSILMQEVDFNYEIVVGEDCSTDNTRKILLDYKNKHPDKFKLLLPDKNIGMMPNVIATLKACTGEYIAMLEGDDYWTDPHKLQIQIDSMQEFPECHMSFHPAYEIVDSKPTKRVISRHIKGNHVFTTSEVILGQGHFSPTASLVFYKNAISNLPSFFATAPGGDYILQILGSLNGGALYIDRVMCAYRRGHPGSWSEKKKIKNVLSNNEYIEREETRSKLFIENLLEMKEFFVDKYENEINQVLAIRYFRMALFYLENKMFENFKYEIENSFSMYYLRSIKNKIFYNLRYWPKFLYIIYGFNKIILKG